ncbi:hypothetical protein ACFLY6_03145 [Candidatus Dependentiae bacterium]
MKISKYDSVGNRFLLIDLISDSYFIEFREKYRLGCIENLLISEQWKDEAANLCSKDSIFGADGVIILFLDSGCPKALIFNSDGSYGQFSVNGSRCIAFHLMRKFRENECKFVLGKTIVWADKSGFDDNVGISICVEGSVPVKAESEGFKGNFIDVGNPHFVVIKEIAKDSFLKIAPIIGCGRSFPESAVNVSFFWSQEEGNCFKGLVFERGVGFTKSCGSAVLALAKLLSCEEEKMHKIDFSVEMPGGKMLVEVHGGSMYKISGYVMRV